MEFIRKVRIAEKDFRRPENGGGPKKSFGDVTLGIRRRLNRRLAIAADNVLMRAEEFEGVPGVIKVRIKKEAWAKTHRPLSLLSVSTCPIIGVGAFGDLFVSATTSGVEALSSRLSNGNSKALLANISAVEDIASYDEDDVFNEAFWGDLERSPASGFYITLFRHMREDQNERLQEHFEKLLADSGLEYRINERDTQKYLVTSEDVNDIAQLASYVGVRSVGMRSDIAIFPQLSSVVGQIDTEDFPGPDEHYDYPVVGCVDSGIPEEHKFLEPWVHGRDVFVPKKHRDFDHGSFVAGLLVNSRRLNHHDDRFPIGEVKIVDTTVLGGVGSKCSPEDLLSILEEQFEKYPEIKIWNLSLGLSTTIDEDRFSEFAVALDMIQDEFDVMIILAAGNYSSTPLREWPSQDIIGENDRIMSPADSVRSLVIGSIACRDSNSSLVKVGEPSPFSRRGPGPAFVPKPDMCSYGGNCNSKGEHTQVGILSINPDGKLAENIGTSFAAPLVSSIAARVYHMTDQGENWHSITKALLIHSSFCRSEVISALSLPYYGFGLPPDADEIVRNGAGVGTLLFDGSIVQGLEFERWPLPIPNCLINGDGKFVGEVVVTLVYDPPLDDQFGAEYCRTNVEVSLGRYLADKNGKRKHKKEIPAQPEDAKQLYEYLRLEFGFKWSPVKVYKRAFTRGISAEDWRLKVTVSNRAEYVSEDAQRFCVMVSFIDPAGEKPVADDLDKAIDALAWEMDDLIIDNRIHVMNDNQGE